MAEQFIQKNYYETTNKKFIDTHLSNKISIEVWLSKLLFHDDLKRVIYSAQDIAFRKRIESIDKGKNDDDIIKPEMLDLPFASFCMSADPAPDDRMAAVNAGESVDGIYYEDEDREMRRLAVMTKYKIVCFFARQDDVRIAQQLLLWEKEPKSPIWMYTPIQWRGVTINLPTFLTIESINTTPNYNEIDWLTKNRIFPIEIEVTSRSYQLLINNVDKIIQLPMRFANYIDDFEEDEDHTSYLTEEVVLTWAAKKFDLDIDTKKIDTTNDEYTNVVPYFVNQDMSNSEIERGVAIPNKYMSDSIKAYFQQDIICSLQAYLYSEPKSTANKACIVYKIKPSTFKYFSKIVFYIPTKKPIEITDYTTKEVYIDGLYPNSEYKLTISVYDTQGGVQEYFINFKTKNSETNEAPQPEKINTVPGLIGMHI